MEASNRSCYSQASSSSGSPSGPPDMAQFWRGSLELVGGQEQPGLGGGLLGHTCISRTPLSAVCLLLQQLHSSVRTGNLETCLRLLSLGAQANFFHPEKGTTPLHVAAKAGQTLQAELLVVYGADPGSPDVNGRTPIDYAR